MKTKEECENDFFAAVTRVLNSAANSPISVSRAIRTAIESPAKKFYVTREYAFRELHRRKQRKGPVRKEGKRDRMWDDLAEALRQRRERCPREGDWEAIDWVLANCRPKRFYISEGYAKKVYYKVLGVRNFQ